jgi:hypothetical protein
MKLADLRKLSIRKVETTPVEQSQKISPQGARE